MKMYRVTFDDSICTHNVWMVLANTEAEAVRKVTQQYTAGWNFRVVEVES